MPICAVGPATGLGTSFVQALTNKLVAHIDIENANPGTSVSIAHSQIVVAKPSDDKQAV
jgi:hypothetical protein